MRKRKKPGTNDGYVYIHIRLDTNVVFYVGKGNGFYYQRAFAKTRRTPKWHAIAGTTKWRYDIVFDKLTKDEALQKEVEVIAKYKRVCDGGTLVNETLGGMGHLGLKGELSPNYGKPHTPERIENMRRAILAAITPETRRKLSDAAKKRVISEETRKKLSLSSTGRKWTDEQKLASSLRQKGKRGQPMTEEAKKKIRETWAKKRAAKSGT